jgi:ATP-binding cassette, subfamily G (WHITE), member 2
LRRSGGARSGGGGGARELRCRRSTRRPFSFSSCSQTHAHPPFATPQNQPPTAEDLDAAESASRPPSSLASSSADLASAASSARHQGAMVGGAAAATAVARQHLGAAVDRVTVEWQRLGCTYRVPGGTKVVLQDVWGIARPGEMQVREEGEGGRPPPRKSPPRNQNKKTNDTKNQPPPIPPSSPPTPKNTPNRPTKPKPKHNNNKALLGPSGAGKSTLMDILAMRKSMGTLTGQLLVNGRPATKSFIRRTAYVPQEDNFVPTMTTGETMGFFASIVLPPHVTKAARKERAADVLAVVGLGAHHRTLVGGSLPGGLLLRGLSGGERKRLSIAAGILAGPSVLYLDEPTSGLDSFAALTVMGYLKRMARDNGHVVISSIHQPRSAIWSMFDAVTLLASGRLMYTGARDGLVEWFGSLGYPYDPTLHGVASDWALDLVAIGFHKPARYYGHTMRAREDVERAAGAFKAHYLASVEGARAADDGARAADAAAAALTLSARVRGAAAAGAAAIANAPAACVRGAQGSGAVDADGGDGTTAPPTPANDRTTYATGWFRQYAACLWREFLVITRNPADVAGRTLTFCWVGLLMGLLYYSLPADGLGLRSRLNLLFNLLAFFCLMPYVSMSLYSADKKFYVADASAKLYRPHAYYAAKVMATVPFQVVSAFVFVCITYGMAGLRPGAYAVISTAFLATLLYLIAVQVLHFCAILAPNQDAAFMLSILWTTVQLLMSSFFINFADVAFMWLTQLRYVSALYYAFEGVAIVQFKDQTLSCQGGLDQGTLSLLRDMLPNTAVLRNTAVMNTLTRPDPRCVVDTNAITRYFNFGRPLGATVAIMLGYWLVVHLMTYGAMILVVRRERR